MHFARFIPAFMAYQDLVQRNSAGELQQKRLCFTNHLGPYFESVALEAIGYRMTQQYAATKLEAGYAPQTVNHHLVILRSYMNFSFETAIETKELPKDAVAPRVHRIKLEQGDEHNCLSAKEVRELILQADLHPNPMYRVAIIVAVNTGIRIGELLALDWAAVNTESSTPSIRIETSLCRITGEIKSTKTGNKRTVALIDKVCAALRVWREGQGNPCTGRVFPSHYITARNALNTIAKRAGISRPVNWHTLRHTFATLLVSGGQPLFVVSKLLGHKSMATSERYAHLSPERGRDAVAILETL